MTVYAPGNLTVQDLPIKSNKAKCLERRDTIKNRDRHHTVICHCGNLTVDGGRDYLRRLWRTDQWTELSEYED